MDIIRETDWWLQRSVGEALQRLGAELGEDPLGEGGYVTNMAIIHWI